MKIILIVVPFVFLMGCGIRWNIESPTKTPIKAEWVYRSETAPHSLNFLVDPAEFTSPILDSSRVYIGLTQGKRVVALDRESGEVIWEHPMLGRIERGLTIQDSYIIAGDIQGNLDVLYKQDGLLKWTKSLGEPIMAAFTCDSHRILVATASDHLLALNISNGSILWEYKRKTIQRQTIAGAFSPIVMDGTAYVGFSDGYLLAFDQETGQKLWEVKVIESDHLTDLDIYGRSNSDYLYVGSPLHGLKLVNLKTRTVLPFYEEEGVATAPIIDNDKIYFATVRGTVHAMDISDPTSPRPLWKHSLPKKKPAFISLSGIYLIVSPFKGDLTLLNPTTGDEVAHLPIGHGTNATMSLDGSNLYLLSNMANLYKSNL